MRWMRQPSSAIRIVTALLFVAALNAIIEHDSVEAFLPERPLPVRSLEHNRGLAAGSFDDTANASSKPRARKTDRRKTSSRKGRRVSKKNVPSGPQVWRVFSVEVHPEQMVGDDCNLNKSDEKTLPVEKRFLHNAVLKAVETRLHVEPDDVSLVRRSLDARAGKRRVDGDTGPRFVYVLDVTIDASKTSSWKHQPGRLELLSPNPKKNREIDARPNAESFMSSLPRIVIVGAGPAGLFCALELARSGVAAPILLERGQPVEARGKDIGALIHGRFLNSESNFAFGEGGAGTWSDGKLTTRIGRNSDAVRQVLETLVLYGAPEKILVEGAPHLGTDNLVRLLRNMRSDFRKLGGEIRFGTRVTDIVIENGVTKGVDYEVTRDTVERNMGELTSSVEKSGRILADIVVLATGHSARDVYEKLHASGVKLQPKGFAVGFRIEHPQKLINKIQYGVEWGPSVITGKKTTDNMNEEFFSSSFHSIEPSRRHNASLPVPSYRLATDQAFDGSTQRGVYSFCMCPGGQIVCASTEPDEVCVNGMSFSRRDSQWANSALVVSVNPDDNVLRPYRKEHGVLAGIAFQRDMEQRAAILGGGNLTVPVQRVTDFLAGHASTSAPSSSYRLGTKAAACHEIYPFPLVQALRDALVNHFEAKMPGFINEDGLLHAVETRTSSPVQVIRGKADLQAIGTTGLFPAGEGAGYAGGIVSAAVDGIHVAEVILQGAVSKFDRIKSSQ